jgi:aminopeptidase N
VCVKTGTKNTDFCTTITEQRQAEQLASCPSWIFGNRDAAGYYRVEYTSEQLKSIAKTAETVLSVPERISLVEDAWAMTRAGKAAVGDFLDLSQQLGAEENLRVVEALANHLDYIRSALVSNQEQAKYDEFLQKQFGTLAQQLGWSARTNDTDEQKALRATLLEALGTANDRDAINNANRLVEQYRENPSSVDATLIGSGFAVAAENGDEALYQRLTDAMRASKSSDEYYHYLYALTDFRQPALLRQTLQLVDEGKIRQQDYPRFFGALLSNPAGRDAAWQYLKSHWDDISQKVTSFGGAGAVTALGNACSAEMRDDVRQFFVDHPAPGAQRAVQQSLERIDDCLSFKNQQSQSLERWLSNR